MKFLMYSENASGAGILHRIKEEGNDVCLFTRHETAYKEYDGMVKKPHTWDFQVDQDTVVLFDCTGFGMQADMLRRAGYATFGGCEYADRLENDRIFAEDLARSIGFKVPESWPFDDIAKAKEFVKGHKGKLVLKPDGESSGTIPSFLPKNDGPEELLDILDHVQSQFIGKVEFILQEFIPDAVEISTEAWFCGRLVRNLNHTIESKKLMDGDSGATIGCAGNVVFPADNPIADRIWDCLSKLPAGPAFGLLDVNCLVTEKDIWWIEWTPRFGYDAAPALFCKGIHGDLGKLFSDLAHGQLKAMPLLDHFSAALRVTLPPYPKKDENFDPWPLRGIDLKDFYGYSINKVDGKVMITNTELGCALGSGDTIESAMGQCLKVAEKIQMSNLQFRHDLAEKFQERYEQLKTVGRVLEAA